MKNRMQIVGTPRESDKMSVFRENKKQNEGQIFVSKIVLGTIAYALKSVTDARFALVPLL